MSKVFRTLNEEEFEQVSAMQTEIDRLKSDLARLTAQKDWQWVPKEATPRMCEQMEHWMRGSQHMNKVTRESHIAEGWKFMLAAAPTDEGEG